MLGNLVKKVFGSSNDRIVKRLAKEVEAINNFESTLEALDDAALKAKTEELRARLDNGETLQQILPEAFAVVREAGKRVFEMRHFDVQMIGGMVLNDGKIAEMRTGEGKTLVATTAVYLNALSGKGVHVITVNDYLAQRDSAWMGQLYAFLGLSTGVIVSGLDTDSRRAAYAADVTYGTNNEFGFDYLRDNMAHQMEQKVQRPLHFAIIDEVDSILIDEARTPLIISGPAEQNSELYLKLNAIVPRLERQAEEEGPGDYSVDEKSKQVHLTEAGHDSVEELLRADGLLGEGESLYDPAHIAVMHHLNAALRAMSLFTKDVDYIVSDDQIVIVDEFTGRTMAGRRWSDGLHQAIEAKEGVTIQRENQTLASITFQNFFRLYEKLSGMTGTADTEAFEFQSIYNLEVVVIPTHREMARKDLADQVFLTQREKYEAIVEDIEECVNRKQPVLVGTTSIEISELIAGLLRQKNISHEVLNAKQHEREAQIIEHAGQASAVTIATNMAGRGTDIVLGGSLEAELAKVDESDTAARQKITDEWQKKHDAVLEAGGLHIIGTERHESRRIDNQLRGRSGRQGDAGSSRFYLSLEDSLMRIFASDRVSNLMQKLGMEEGEAIEHTWVTKAIENAQRKVEGHNFDIRKHLLEYDDVANDQRKVVYEQRDELMAAEDVVEYVNDIRDEIVPDIIERYMPTGSMEEQWDLDGLEAELLSVSGEKIDVKGWLEENPNLPEEDIASRVLESLVTSYDAKVERAGEEQFRRFEKFVMLQSLDDHWKEHLAGMDYLRQSVGLRGYAQKNPKQEFKREAFELFHRMLAEFKREVTSKIATVQIRDAEQVEEAEANRAQSADVTYEHKSADSALANDPQSEAHRAMAAAREAGAGGSGVPIKPFQREGAEPVKPFVRDVEKVGRNDPCPCGSGKKYKQCHGKLT